MKVIPTGFAVGLDGSVRERKMIPGLLAYATAESMESPAIYGDGGCRFRSRGEQDGELSFGDTVLVRPSNLFSFWIRGEMWKRQVNWRVLCV